LLGISVFSIGTGFSSVHEANEKRKMNGSETLIIRANFMVRRYCIRIDTHTAKWLERILIFQFFLALQRID
jgi:hypothetical protein